MSLSLSNIKAYARLLDAGMRTIDQVNEEYRVPVYIELITNYKWTMEQVDPRYKEEVMKEFMK